jgi:hypothetical protein
MIGNVGNVISSPVTVHIYTVIETDLFNNIQNDNTLDLIGLYTSVFCWAYKMSKINRLAAMPLTLLLQYDYHYGRWFYSLTC